MMRRMYAVVLAAGLAGCAHQKSNAPPGELASSTDKPAASARLAPRYAPADVQELRRRAHVRVVQDDRVYSKQQLKEVESLYEKATAADTSRDDAQAAMDELIKMYPKANRTGCTVLSVAMRSVGEERERYLRQAVRDHDDCFHKDGVQIGPYARLMLAQYYARTGDNDRAFRMCDQIRAFYPEAIDHSGLRLIEQFPHEAMGPGDGGRRGPGMGPGGAAMGAPMPPPRRGGGF